MNSVQSESHLAVSNFLLSYLEALGLSPLPVSNLTVDLDFLVRTLSPRLIVLSGGESIGDLPERDAFENDALTLAKKHQIPVLGICRGMQVMGVSMGAELRPIRGHAGVRHGITGVFNKEVNSFHNFGFTEAPKDFTVLARSDDGTVEAFLEDGLHWVGVMWHPERESPFDAIEAHHISSLLGLN
jgi:putative glutamine amidotransferase